MMKSILILILFCQIYYSFSEFMSGIGIQTRAPCDNQQEKNTLIEHFFNTIFTEFHSLPPVCVCVQMCVGQPTYCYPNGCLKNAAHEENRDENDVKSETTQYPIMQKNKNHFMLLKGERDFMTEFLDKNYVDESKEPTQPHNPVEDLRPDVFKKKYHFIGKYKTAPNVNLRKNIHDKVKKDVLKTESVDWTKTRWPLYSQNWRSGRKAFSNIDKPLKTQGTYFAAMLRDNEIAEYPPKYFKRELTKSIDDDEGNIKAFYNLENSLNVTDGKSFSLETLIDNLIRSSFGTNIETTTNIAIAKRDDTKIETKVPIENLLNVNSTALANETTSVISMNLTNKNVDRNKYLDTSQMKKTTILNDIITILANRIEDENNTSMEIAKRTIKNFDEESLKEVNDETTLLNSAVESTVTNLASNGTVLGQILISEATIMTTNFEHEMTTTHKLKVTKKNRQKVVKKASSKMNNPDVNLRF